MAKTKPGKAKSAKNMLPPTGKKNMAKPFAKDARMNKPAPEIPSKEFAPIADAPKHAMGKKKKNRPRNIGRS